MVSTVKESKPSRREAEGALAIQSQREAYAIFVSGYLMLAGFFGIAPDIVRSTIGFSRWLEDAVDLRSWYSALYTMISCTRPLLMLILGATLWANPAFYLAVVYGACAATAVEAILGTVYSLDRLGKPSGSDVDVVAEAVANASTAAVALLAGTVLRTIGNLNRLLWFVGAALVIRGLAELSTSLLQLIARYDRIIDALGPLPIFALWAATKPLWAMSYLIIGILMLVKRHGGFFCISCAYLCLATLTWIIAVVPVFLGIIHFPSSTASVAFVTSATMLPGIAAGLLWFVWQFRYALIDAEGVCRRCGYSLVGLPSGPYRCPECGEPFTNAEGSR